MKLCFKHDDKRCSTSGCKGTIKTSFVPLPCPVFTYEMMYERWLLECWLLTPMLYLTAPYEEEHMKLVTHTTVGISSGFLSITVQHCKPRRPAAVLQLPYHKWAQSHIFFEIRMWSFTERTIKLWNSQCFRGQKQNHLHDLLKKYHGRNCHQGLQWCG